MSKDIKHIALTNDKFAIVDADLYDSLMRFEWRAVKKRRSWYAVTTITGKHGSYDLYMHRLIANTPPNMVTHHINRNSLYNRRANLQNMLRSDHKIEHINNPIKVIAGKE